MSEQIYKEFTAVVPAYNEAKRFEKVASCLLSLKELKQLILVDDGSADNTEEKAKKLASLDERFIYVRHSKNKGKGSALKTGIKKAKTEVILFLDADLENMTPQKIRKIVNPVMKGEIDVSRGAFRRARGRVTEYAVKPMMSILFPDMYFKQPISGQVCAKKSFLKTVDFESNYGVDIGILFDAIQAGQRIVEVDIGWLEHKKNAEVDIAKMSEQVLSTMIKKAGLIQHKYKLVVFTLDNTLIKSSEIDKVFKKLGILNKINKIRAEYESDTIDFQTYLTNLAMVFKGIRIEDVEGACESIAFEKYVPEVIRAIQKRKYQVAILSSHFSPIVKTIAAKLGVQNIDCIKLTEKNELFTGEIAKDSINHWVNHSDQQAFLESFQKVKTKAKVRSREAIMVANSDKAIPLLEKVGLGIAYKPRNPELKAIAEKTIHILPELLAIIE